MKRFDQYFEQGLNRNEDEKQFLELSLSTYSPKPPIHPIPIQPPSMPIPPPQEQAPQPEPMAEQLLVPRPRARKQPTQRLRQGKTETVPAPYPWAKPRRATIHSLDYLLSNGINVVTGQVQCKRCETRYEIEYDLKQTYLEIARFVSKNKGAMHDRAPNMWMNPSTPNCKNCGETNCVRPVTEKKKAINWLFLFLGQMVGFCKLKELKYFCKHTRNHRTGAKDRLVYLTYLALCKQLDPNGPF